MDDKVEIIVEDDEEVPSNVRKKIKVLEMPLFDQDDKRRIEKVLEKIDRLSEIAQQSPDVSIFSELRNSINRMDSFSDSVVDVRDSVARLSSFMKSNDARLAHIMEQLGENEEIKAYISKISASLRVQESSIEKISRVIEDESGMEMIHGINARLSHITESLQSSNEVTERIIEILEKNQSQGATELRDAISALAEAVGANEGRLSAFLGMLLDMATIMKERAAAMDGQVEAIRGSMLELSEKLDVMQSPDISEKMDFLEANSILVSDKLDKINSHAALQVISEKMDFLEANNIIISEKLDNIHPEKIMEGNMKLISEKMDFLEANSVMARDSVDSLSLKMDVLDEIRDSLDSKFGGLEENYSALSGSVDSVSQSIRESGVAVKDSLNALSARVSSIDNNLSAMEDSINALSAGIALAKANDSNGLKGVLESLALGIDSISSRVDSMKNMDNGESSAVSIKIAALDNSLAAIEDSFISVASGISRANEDSMRSVKEKFDAMLLNMDSISSMLDAMRRDDSQAANLMDTVTGMDGKMSNFLLSASDYYTVLDGKSDVISSQLASLAAEAIAARQDSTKIASFIDRTLDSVEDTRNYVELSQKTFQDLAGKISSGDIDAKLNALDSDINYIKGALVLATDNTASASEDANRKFSAGMENVINKFDAHTAIMNNRLENISLQVMEPINDMSLRLNDIGSKISGGSINASDISRLSAATQTFAKNVKELKGNEISSLLDEMRKINIHLSKLDDSEFLLRISDVRKSMPRRMPVADRRRLNQSIKAIEDELMDVSIITLVKKKKSNIALIAKTLKISQNKVRDRVRILVRGGRIKAEKLGRYTVYTA